ncbi:MAG: hydrogenase maturation protease [Micromonosporaceae bacterium]|nr:hydrogenase maturation protease [Micromonosporaceae bacterium]
MTRIRVIGVGNPYRRDDGAGPAVIAGLRHRCPPTVKLAECDGEPTRLIDLWDGADLAVVVDAVRSGAPPGTIHRRSLRHPSFGRAGCAASHAVDLGDAVALAAALDRLPTRMLLYLVEADNTSTGVGLTPAVEVAVAELVDEIAEEVTWRATRR